jgi:TolA-binding protein
VIKITSLIIFVSFFSLTGCSPDQYTIERQYWQLKKQRDEIISNPQASLPIQLEKAVNALTNFIQKNPENKLVVEADLDIATLYVAKNEYEKAREQLSKMLNKYSKNEAICSEVLYLRGYSYQMEDKWDSAIQEYKKIMQNYPLTTRGLDIPVYIAQYYKENHQSENMIAAYKEAVTQYVRLADRFPGSNISFYFANLIGQCYMELKEWQNALNSFNDILENYKGKGKLDGILMDVAVIYAYQLNDKERARQALQRLIREYPKSKFIKTAEVMLKE